MKRLWSIYAPYILKTISVVVISFINVKANHFLAKSFMDAPNYSVIPAFPEKHTKKRVSENNSETLIWKEAATYSPALHCSTIGASRLNFSVRNGKRWNPAAITTWYGVDLLTRQSCIGKTHTVESVCYSKKAFGQLVVLGFDVTVFRPAPYQRRSLRRPSMESSSCGWLRT